MDLSVKSIFEKLSGKCTSNLNAWIIYGHNEGGFFNRSIIFTNISKGIIKRIIADGKFRKFPCIENKEKVNSYIREGSLEPYVRYRSYFERKPDGRIMMIWQVQPDGKYWADDDGFGGTNDCEVCLYSYLDSKGNFNAPFRIYNIGCKQYYKEP